MQRNRWWIATLALTGAMLVGAGCGSDDEPASGDTAAEASAMTIELTSAEDDDAGTVTITEDEESGGVEVSAEVSGLEPGFHGFHIHEIAECEPDSTFEGERGAFLSAGGHYTAGTEDHGEHSGDMPPLQANEDGDARATVIVPTYTLAELDDSDGSAVMVHATRDNLANIPPDRYRSDDGPGPDEDTLATGDSGDRVACGIVEPAT